MVAKGKKTKELSTVVEQRAGHVGRGLLFLMTMVTSSLTSLGQIS